MHKYKRLKHDSKTDITVVVVMEFTTVWQGVRGTYAINVGVNRIKMLL